MKNNKQYALLLSLGLFILCSTNTMELSPADQFLYTLGTRAIDSPVLDYYKVIKQEIMKKVISNPLVGYAVIFFASPSDIRNEILYRTCPINPDPTMSLCEMLI